MRPFLLFGLAPILPVTPAVGQIPVVDGVIGGVPQAKYSKTRSFASYKPRDNLNGTVTATITPGILRYVENSGYAQSNPYHRLVSLSTIKSANASLYRPGGCLSQIADCNNDGSDSACLRAQDYCFSKILTRLPGKYDAYDVRAEYPNPYPYNITGLLSNSSFKSKIGAQSEWQFVNSDIYNKFSTTGDVMRSARSTLGKVVDAGVRVLLPVGDTDYLCNYMGSEAVIDAMQTQFTSLYKQQQWTNWTVASITTGLYKNAGTLSYIRVSGAGHEVPTYGNEKLAAGQAALVYFTQAMQGKPVSST
ncbi:hypothetical protein FRC08_000809 [Ceratobasidium sp. 394]|nr:hypothetical protein FRC08_000809 [Ceratobasidium sp. 394]